MVWWLYEVILLYWVILFILLYSSVYLQYSAQPLWEWKTCPVVIFGYMYDHWLQIRNFQVQASRWPRKTGKHCRFMLKLGIVLDHWIGLRGKIWTGNPWVFTIKYRGFRLKFSHHPILWLEPRDFIIPSSFQNSAARVIQSLRLASELLSACQWSAILQRNNKTEKGALDQPNRPIFEKITGWDSGFISYACCIAIDSNKPYRMTLPAASPSSSVHFLRTQECNNQKIARFSDVVKHASNDWNSNLGAIAISYDFEEIRIWL